MFHRKCRWIGQRGDEVKEVKGENAVEFRNKNRRKCKLNPKKIVSLYLCRGMNGYNQKLKTYE